MTMVMKQGLLTWSYCNKPLSLSLSRVSHSSHKTQKLVKPNSCIKIFSHSDGKEHNADGSSRECRVSQHSLLLEIDNKERFFLKHPTTVIIVTHAIMFARPLQVLAETCEADNSIFNMNMPLLLFFSLIGATVGGLLARQRRGELQRLNEQLHFPLVARDNTQLRSPSLSYVPVSGRIAENEVIVDSRKQDLISRLKNGKNFLRNQDHERAFSEFKIALELAQNLKDPIEEKKAARGLGASMQRQGKYRDAIKYHSMVLEISQRGEESGNTEAYGAIADCYTELRDLECAAKYYDEYISRLQSD